MSFHFIYEIDETFSFSEPKAGELYNENFDTIS